MHMADALLSPQVGVGMWVVSAVAIAYSSKKIKSDSDDKIIPLMGILGAFIFAAQMINFSIPGTGSSGHLGGGLLLSIILGPYPAVIVMTSVLAIQALFFADGGLLALGANIFNMGIIPAFIIYPLFFKHFVNESSSYKKIYFFTINAAILTLVLGAFLVVTQTTFSGISELPFRTFILFMLPIHLGIGLVEGIISAGVLSYLQHIDPSSIKFFTTAPPKQSRKPVFIRMALLILCVGGFLSWFASGHPDGLEWSVWKTSGVEELSHSENSLNTSLGFVQEKTAFMPDYGFKDLEITNTENEDDLISPETSLAGIIGSSISLFVIGFIGFILVRKKQIHNVTS